MRGVSEENYATFMPHLQLWPIVQPKLHMCVSRATHNMWVIYTFTMGPDVRINSPTPNGHSDHGPSRNSFCFSSSMDVHASLASPSRQVMLHQL